MAGEVNFNLDDAEIRSFENALKGIGDLPNRVVNSAVSKAVTPIARAIRKAAPVGKTKQLRKGITRKREKTRVQRGKVVYQLRFDPAKNDVFQKPIKNPGARGGNAKKATGYYPASMEYGYFTGDGNGGYKKVPGLHFMRDAADAGAASFRENVTNNMMAGIEKEWMKKHGEH